MKAMKALGTGMKLAGLSLVAALAVNAAPATAAETVKIFRSTMPDGHVVLGDKPAEGAKSVASDTIVLTAPAGAADAEREYWRNQAEAFNRRQLLRESARRSGNRAPHRHHDDLALYQESPPAHFYGHGVSKPIVSLRRVPRQYRSSPGAVRGRSSGFIGSGFSTAR